MAGLLAAVGLNGRIGGIPSVSGNPIHLAGALAARQVRQVRQMYWKGQQV